MTPYEVGYYETLYKLGFAMKQADDVTRLPTQMVRGKAPGPRQLPGSAQKMLAAIPAPPPSPFGAKPPVAAPSAAPAVAKAPPKTAPQGKPKAIAGY